MKVTAIYLKNVDERHTPGKKDVEANTMQGLLREARLETPDGFYLFSLKGVGGEILWYFPKGWANKTFSLEAVYVPSGEGGDNTEGRQVTKSVYGSCYEKILKSAQEDLPREGLQLKSLKDREEVKWTHDRGWAS